jgi:hypothetical protein
MTSGAVRRLLLLGVLALAACEPSGEGALDAVVQAPAPTGAVTVEVTGTGVVGFEGVGDVRTFAGSVSPTATVHRVVVVSVAGAQQIRFRVLVEDVGDAPPTASVRAAVDPSNAPIDEVGGYSVRISR